MERPWILKAVALLLALGKTAMSPHSVAFGSVLIDINHVEGNAYVNEQRLEPSATPFRIMANSVVRTEDGQVEIFLYESVLVFLGKHTSLRIANNSPYNSPRLELLTGSTIVATGDMGSLVTCENTVTLSHSGLYRFDVHHLPAVEPPSGVKLCGLRVTKGAAAVQLMTVVSVLTRGDFMSLSLGCGDLIPIQKFNVEETDNLDDWSRGRLRLRGAQ